MIERPIGKGAVVAFFFACQQHMQSIMEVIAPLRVVEGHTSSAALEKLRLVGFILQHQMHMPTDQARTYRLGELIEEMLFGIVFQRMNGIEP